MRHLTSGRKLSRSSSHRIALARSQATSLLRHGRIKTTLAKAKNLQPYVEKLITTARGGDLHARRLISREIHDHDVQRKLMNEIAPSYAQRAGGYTRIYRLTSRRGDGAQEALIELVTGFVMEKLFHHRWWDYSQRPLNIGGYVCALYSLVWGFACVLIVDAVHPIISGFVSMIPSVLSTVLLAVFVCAFVTDSIATVNAVTKLNLRLTQIEEASAALRKFSDTIGANMAEGAIVVAEKNRERSEDLKEKGAELKALGEAKGDEIRQRREALHARYEELLSKLPFGEKRLLRAFPDLRSRLHGDILEELKARHLSDANKKHKEK